jgi:hypothetical protein
MLAYVFWHRPRDDTEAEAYEEASVAFHRSLAHRRPVGMRASCALRLAELPWLAATGGDGGSAESGRSSAGGYEDWYLIDDFTALGVLNEAAVGRGHRTSHDRIARRSGAGAGGVYALVEGEPVACGEAGASSQATWVALPPGSAPQEVFELLADGIDPGRASLWRRQLVLGPAPEFCLLASEAPPGVASTRLPSGWTARTLERWTLFSG